MPHRKRLCTFTDSDGERCPHRAECAGLCVGHTMQKRRGGVESLRPLRSRGANGKLPVRVPSLSVSIRAGSALAARGPTLSLAARDVIEEWAKEQEVLLLCARTLLAEDD